jgi:hypothetical protein
MLMFRKLVEVGMKVSDKLDEHLLPDAGYTNSNTSCTSCELDNEGSYRDIVRSSYETYVRSTGIKDGGNYNDPSFANLINLS